MLAGLAAAMPGLALADGTSAGVLRAETQAISGAIGTQLQPGLRTVLPSEGTPLHADPEPGSPVLQRLGAGTPVIVTRPADATGWAEVMVGGQHGYVWAPHLISQGLPPAPWAAER
jgi:hypothetical protein